MNNSFRFFIFLFLISSLGYAQRPDDQIKIEGRTNDASQLDKPYVILISIDGFRDDYLKKYNPKFLNKMGKKGVRAEALIPSYPSVTFPNHYTLVTGLIPPHHGLVGNNMLDIKTGKRYSLRNQEAVQNKDWYGGFPIWSLAESQKMLSACFYWPGSEAPIQDLYPSYYYPYSETKGMEERIETVVDWLNLPKATRPHLITFYMPEVDHAGHRYGPESLETKWAVNYVDESMEKLYQAVQKTNLPVNFVLVSDHGMTALDTENPIKLPKINPEEMEVVSNGVYVSIFTKNPDQKDSIYRYFKENKTDHYDVYRKSEVPEKYRFDAENDTYGRIGDVVLLAKAPFYFSQNNLIPKGSHGYHPEDNPDMNTVFIAWGPQLKKGMVLKPFQNTEVYAVLAKLLQLDYDEDSIDGTDEIANKIIR